MEFDDISYPWQVHYQQVTEDIRMAYIDEGAGQEVILFIHGLGSYLPAWKKNVEALKKDFRCIAVDLPGYGKSSKGDYPFTMEFYADMLNDLLERMGISSAWIAGHSMGGQIAMVMSLKYPERVSGLLLIAPAGLEKFTEGEKQWFREVMTVNAVKNTPVKQIRANVVANFYRMPEDAEFMVTDRIALRKARDFEWYCYTVVKSVQGMVDQPVYEKLGDISKPTLILFGENDNLIPNPYLHGGKTEDIGRIGKEKIRNSKLVMIPGCGHFAQFEKPEIVNREIMTFVRENKKQE